MGAAVILLCVLGFGGALLTAVYSYAYGRAGYDDWGNYLALLPMLSPLMLFALPIPGVRVAAGCLLLLGVTGTPALLVWRRVRKGMAG